MKLAVRLVRNYDDDGVKRWTIELVQPKCTFKPDADAHITEFAQTMKQHGIEVERYDDFDNTKSRIKEPK